MFSNSKCQYYHIYQCQKDLNYAKLNSPKKVPLEAERIQTYPFAL